MVTSSAPTPIVPSTSPRPLYGNLTVAGQIAVINGTLMGIGSVYLATRSILVTLMAAVSSVILGGLALLVR
jgi:hypothetical protein